MARGMGEGFPKALTGVEESWLLPELADVVLEQAGKLRQRLGMVPVRGEEGGIGNAAARTRHGRRRQLLMKYTGPARTATRQRRRVSAGVGVRKKTR